MWPCIGSKESIQAKEHNIPQRTVHIGSTFPFDDRICFLDIEWHKRVILFLGDCFRESLALCFSENELFIMRISDRKYSASGLVGFNEERNVFEIV